MDSNYRANILKWLPVQGPVLEKWFKDSLELDGTLRKVSWDIDFYVEITARGKVCDQEVLTNFVRRLEKYAEDYRLIWKSGETSHPVYKAKVQHIKMNLQRSLNVVAKFIRNLIYDIMDCKNDEFLRIIFRLVNAYNKMLDLEPNFSEPSINIFSNNCPCMLEPLKKISVTRMLQVLAKNKVEDYCHEFIECLLANYQCNMDKEDTKSTADVDLSENSSIEIYRALTKHLTPPVMSLPAKEMEMSNVESVQILVSMQNEEVTRLMNITMSISPELLGTEALKTVNKDEKKIREMAMKKIKEFYQEVAWGSISSILDHVVLWWSPKALAVSHSRGAQHFKDWLHRFLQKHKVPSTVRPALQNLCDTLGCHVTVTAWDERFRRAYTSSFACQSKPSSEISKGTDTGHKFLELFKLLVINSNECETCGEWDLGAPLIQLPLSEQIVVLHRLDHSVHTMRLWSLQEAKEIAHTWDLEVFFLLVKGDVVNCMQELQHLKLADHTTTLETEPISVQVYVCAKMRAKIVSEVNANILLLKEAPLKCINTLAIICRIVSLANLHMCFPKPNYWRKNCPTTPAVPSGYVESYFEKVLLPVLEVIDNHEISNTILRIMCEAWLDYIYLHQVKFSDWGAFQLLTDFAYVSKWVIDCPVISENVRNLLLKNEVLRRCEGVGRLLLRHPGEAIAMNKPPQPSKNENGSPQSLGLERMPAEMYVPNQEQWLELRAPKRYNFCCTE
ncbi:coiled-coil domain-containing protein 142 [Belonocnema kinseyi]|uniref:coiled-coil domain-containing protein 142 n=1 Tax=Belonocnema kinseyi TaxID=2817044 RepID=UPI00143D06EC|nr:coiled-coil domain-containing protein 142 [Belonocnema kinseyi]